MRAASHQKSGERLSNLEGFRSECALRAVAEDFVAADPIIPLMLATHVGTASRYCIAFDRLLIESSTRSGPVLETAGLKVEVERTAGRVGSESHNWRGFRICSRRSNEAESFKVFKASASSRRRLRRLLSVYGLGLGLLPHFMGDVGRLMDKEENAFFVSDDDIGRFFIHDVAGDNLRADPGVVVD